MTVSDTELATLSRRLRNARFVLWLSGSSPLAEDLRKDLSRIVVSAAFVEGGRPELESYYQGARPRDGRQVRIVRRPEDVEVRGPCELPVFCLPEAKGGPRDRALRAAMFLAIERLVNEDPVFVAFTEKPDAPSFLEFAEMVAEVDATVPVVTICPNWLSSVPPPNVAALACLSSWSDFVSLFAGYGIDVLQPDAGTVAVRVGSVAVPLSEVMEDPTLRIDDRWRILTSNALDMPQGTDEFDLFQEFLTGDERLLAPSMIEDLHEWWAIGKNLPFHRSGLEEAVRTVIAELEQVRQKQGEFARVCWLPAEPASGCTVMLHMIAHRVASAGYPTLVLRQHVDTVDGRQVAEFLTLLNRLAVSRSKEKDHGAGTMSEQPALVVLDSQHARSEQVCELPEELGRKWKRQVVTLFALPLPSGRSARTADQDEQEYYTNLVLSRGLGKRTPHKNDVLLSAMREGIVEGELDSLISHVNGLRDRGHKLSVKTLETWRHSLETDCFHLPAIDDLQEEEKERLIEWAKPESLFWPALQHFLNVTAGDDPVHSFAAGRWKAILACGELDEESLVKNRMVCLVLSLTKLSSWGIVTPMSVLRDWMDTSAVSDSRAVLSEDSSAQQEMRVPATRTDIERFLQKWKERRPTSSPSFDVPARIRPTDLLRQLLRHCETQGVVRSFVTDSDVWYRVSHKRVAGALVAEAIRCPDVLPKLTQTEVGDLRVLYDPEAAAESLSPLLHAIQDGKSQQVFAEYLSENLLKGRDSWDGWRYGMGENRLALYERLPRWIEERSRVVLHHHAVVLRRTTFSACLPLSEKKERLFRASELLKNALTLPRRTGSRDEHPGHLRTTLGLVYENLRKMEPAEAEMWLTKARAELEAALCEVPDSRATRQALANMLVEMATDWKASPDQRRRERAVGLAAEALTWLSIEPSFGYESGWYATKLNAARLFDDQDGNRFVESLKKARIEDGYLLSAELALTSGHREHALAELRDLVEGNGALQNPRASHRLASLMAEHADQKWNFTERYRLLASFESSGRLLFPEDKFQLAWLSFQEGRYQDGTKRFTALRNTGQARLVGNRETVYLFEAGHRRAMRLKARLKKSLDPNKAWVSVLAPTTGAQVFDAPIILKWFYGVRTSAADILDVVVRFTGLGPRAVPVRFAQNDGF